MRRAAAMRHTEAHCQSGIYLCGHWDCYGWAVWESGDGMMVCEQHADWRDCTRILDEDGVSMDLFGAEVEITPALHAARIALRTSTPAEEALSMVRYRERYAGELLLDDGTPGLTDEDIDAEWAAALESRAGRGDL